MTLEEAYHILGVGRDASAKEVRLAYRRKALEMHPDRHVSSQDKIFFTRKFNELKEAYELLKRQDSSPARSLQRETDTHSKTETPRSIRRPARRIFPTEESEPMSDFEKLGLRPSWNVESWVLWGVVIPAAVLVLIFLIRFFAGIINP